MSIQIVLKFLATCFLGCLLVFSSIKFYTQPLPPSSWPFHQIYHLLLGSNPHPSDTRPFPTKGDYTYFVSDKVDTGEKGPTVYARSPTLILSEMLTEVTVIFDSINGQTLPPISALAPEAAIQ